MYLISVTPKKSWESHVDVFFVGAEFFLLRKKPSLGGKFFPVATARATGDTHPKDTMHLSKLEKCCGEWRLAEIKGNTCNSNKVEAKTPGPEFKRASKESWQRCFFSTRWNIEFAKIMQSHDPLHEISMKLFTQNTWNRDKSGLFQLFPIPKRPCWPGKKVLYRGHRVPESHLQHFHRIAFQQWMEGTWLHRSVNSQPFSRLQSAEKIQKSKIIISVSATAQKLFGLQNHLQ